MEFEFPYAVNMTLNKMYYTNFNNKGMKFLTREAKAFRATIVADVEAQVQMQTKFSRGDYLEITIFFTDKFLNNDGSIKKRDLDNRLKFLIDSVFLGLKLDDSQIWRINAHKIHDPVIKHTRVEIHEAR